MARPEYDSYLSLEDEIVKETFRNQEENIRIANEQVDILKTKVSELENRILVLEQT